MMRYDIMKTASIEWNIPFYSPHIECSVLKQPLWGTAGLREHYRHLRQITHKRLSYTPFPSHDLHTGRPNLYLVMSFLNSRMCILPIHCWCNPPPVFQLPRCVSVTFFFTPTHSIPGWFCIPCHSKGCDPWQTPCGAGVETQGSSPLLHWSLPYCPCPYACPAPSPLLSSWSRQESLSASWKTRKWDYRRQRSIKIAFIHQRIFIIHLKNETLHIHKIGCNPGFKIGCVFLWWEPYGCHETIWRYWKRATEKQWETVLTEKFMLLNWLTKGFIQGSSCLLTGLFIWNTADKTIINWRHLKHQQGLFCQKHRWLKELQTWFSSLWHW